MAKLFSGENLEQTLELCAGILLERNPTKEPRDLRVSRCVFSFLAGPHGARALLRI